MKKTQLFLHRCVIMVVFCTAVQTPLAAPAENISLVQPYEFTNTSVVPIQSTDTGLRHQLIISLPDSYAAQPNKTYPVVYYLDAYWDFPLLYATYGNLRYDRAIPEAILVGLSVPKDTAINTYRARYFTAESNPQEHSPTGDAAIFYKHLSQDIIPFIDAHYRSIAAPHGRVLAGQSKGGLFALYSLYQKPRIVQRFIAINPAISGNQNAMRRLDSAQARDSKSLAARVFISHGSVEYSAFRDPIISFKKQLQKRHYQGLMLRSHSLEGMGHTGGKGEAYSKGLLWVLQDLAPREKSGLQVDMGG